MGFLHVYMGYTQPLFIQAIMTLKGVFECVVFFIAPRRRGCNGTLILFVFVPFRVPAQIQARHVVPVG